MRTPSEPIAYTIPDAVRAAGIGTTKLYELIGAGTLDARKVGRRTVIMADSLRAFMSSAPRATIRMGQRQKAA